MPDITFDDIQQDVEKIRKTLGDLKTILDQLDKARSVVCIVVNATHRVWTFSGDNHDHGGFATTPPATISPRSGGAFGSQSKGGSLFTGTEGYVRYTGGGVTVKLYWDNPWAGSNGSNATLEAGDPEHFLTWSVTGAGDQKAEMQYVIFERPFQDAWRYCDKCSALFLTGTPRRGSAKVMGDRPRLDIHSRMQGIQPLALRSISRTMPLLVRYNHKRIGVFVGNASSCSLTATQRRGIAWIVDHMMRKGSTLY